MSGAEALVVLGGISSILTIVDGIKKLYDAASDAEGIPQDFREVAGRLPIARNILDSAKEYIGKGDVDEDSCKAVKNVIEACQKKAEKLNELFHEIVPSDDASRVTRYASAAKSLGKGKQVKESMKGILEDVQLLASNHVMNTISNTQMEQVAKAIRDVAAISRSSAILRK
jgi:hypothetical protein